MDLLNRYLVTRFRSNSIGQVSKILLANSSQMGKIWAARQERKRQDDPTVEFSTIDFPDRTERQQDWSTTLGF